MRMPFHLVSQLFGAFWHEPFRRRQRPMNCGLMAVDGLLSGSPFLFPPRDKSTFLLFPWFGQDREAAIDNPFLTESIFLRPNLCVCHHPTLCKNLFFCDNRSCRVAKKVTDRKHMPCKSNYLSKSSTNLIDVARDLNSTHLTSRVHARGFVNHAAPDVEHWLASTNDSAHNLSQTYTCWIFSKSK